MYHLYHVINSLFRSVQDRCSHAVCKLTRSPVVHCCEVGTSAGTAPLATVPRPHGRLGKKSTTGPFHSSRAKVMVKILAMLMTTEFIGIAAALFCTQSHT
jgi:hypothetical protein